MKTVLLPLAASALLAACQSTPAPKTTARVPRTGAAMRVDAWLDEDCYWRSPTADHFTIACAPGKKPQRMRAWLAWAEDALYFAFAADDTTLVAAPPSPREHDVDAQDRVEIFLWSGRARDAYHCIEISPSGAVHDYAARFYRQFDDAWKPAGLRTAVRRDKRGYVVEGAIPRAALAAMGFMLRPGEKIRCGLFRADFHPDAPKSPTWITWVDARTKEPDFHVAAAFGEITLQP